MSGKHEENEKRDLGTHYNPNQHLLLAFLHCHEAAPRVPGRIPDAYPLKPMNTGDPAVSEDQQTC